MTESSPINFVASPPGEPVLPGKRMWEQSVLPRIVEPWILFPGDGIVADPFCRRRVRSFLGPCVWFDHDSLLQGAVWDHVLFWVSRPCNGVVAEPLSFRSVCIEHVDTCIDACRCIQTRTLFLKKDKKKSCTDVFPQLNSLPLGSGVWGSMGSRLDP